MSYITERDCRSATTHVGGREGEMNRHDAKSATFIEPDARVDALARAVLDAAFEVHRHLGPGFLESVYEEALTAELELRDVAFARQVVTGVYLQCQRVASRCSTHRPLALLLEWRSWRRGGSLL